LPFFLFAFLRQVGSGKGFAVVCPPLKFGDELGCEGDGVMVVGGVCAPAVTGCQGDTVHIVDGKCVAKVDKFLEAYLDKVSEEIKTDAATVTAELQTKSDEMLAEVNQFKRCGLASKLFLGVGATGADDTGCSKVVADSETLETGMAAVKQLAEKDLGAVTKGLAACGSTDKLYLGEDTKGADANGCSDAVAKVANAAKAASLITEIPSDLSCGEGKKYGIGEIVIYRPKGEVTQLMLICDGQTLTTFSKAGPKVQDFEYTGTSQDYEVPFGVEKLEIKAWGAGGGTGYSADNNQRSRGGSGAFATTTVKVTLGDKFKVIVGEGGVLGLKGGVRNSFGGGGQGNWWNHGDYKGANGGGLSGVFKTTKDFSKSTWTHTQVSWNVRCSLVSSSAVFGLEEKWVPTPEYGLT
jgi:hypothetical protein